MKGGGRWRDRRRWVALSARLLAGRRAWIVVLVPLLWPAFQAFLLLTGGRREPFTAAAAQNTLIALPVTVVAIFLGVRVIAGELDARRLELAYTVPGGSQRLWLGKLLAAAALAAASVLLEGLAVYAFFTPFPPAALYGALSATLVYLVLAMGLAALFKSEVTGAMVTAGLLAANGVLTGFGDLPSRFSPFWNPLALADTDPATLFAWTLQNRIGCLLAIAALTALAFARAERREAMLAG